jgi:hypothetical protein
MSEKQKGQLMHGLKLGPDVIDAAATGWREQSKGAMCGFHGFLASAVGVLSEREKIESG